MKRDVISDLFLMLWFQKDSLDTVGSRTLVIPKCTEWYQIFFGSIPNSYFQFT